MGKAKAKNWAYNDFAQKGALELEVAGKIYHVAQMTMTFAVNEVPKCTCLVAIGADARTLKQATIHVEGPLLSQMLPAKVTFRPKKEWNVRGTPWGKEQVIFDGYYVGLAWRKISNKVQAVMHLTHWLIDLSHSSTLSKNSHPSNPTSLVAPAVMPSLDTGAGVQPNYVSYLVGHEAIKNKVRTDLWEGIKTMLCNLADVNKFEPGCGAVLGTGSADKVNTVAKKALRRIQGPGGDCSLAYDTDMGGFKLPLNTQGVPLVPEACADAITTQTMESWAHLTFWDTIVGVFCPMFNMAIIPQVDIATVVADVPALNRTWIKNIKVEEFDAFDLTGMVSKPLAGVAVYGEYESMTGWEKTEVGKGNNICIGGQFVEDAQTPSDGQWLVIKSPSWLRTVTKAGLYAGSTTGVLRRGVSNTGPTPADPGRSVDQTPGEILPKLRNLYNEFARSVYVANMLRGRGATISSKLRFDIAPGSIVEMTQIPDTPLKGVDAMAANLYGHVTRVTCNINAEAAMAGTTFHMTHIRTPREMFINKRTFVTEHPLFGPNVYVGSPLIKGWVFADD